MTAGVRARWTFTFVLAILLVLIAIRAAALAQDPRPVPEAGRGLELSQKFCAGCHLIDGSSTPVPAGLPSLRAIANRSGQTGQRIHDVLIQPHAPMPDMRLSINEIMDIIAYLDTLRQDQSQPLLKIELPRAPRKTAPG